MKKLVFFLLPLVMLLCCKCKKENTEEVLVPNHETILGLDMTDGRLLKTINLNDSKIDSFFISDTAVNAWTRHIGYTIDKNDSLYIFTYNSRIYLVNYLTKKLKESFYLNLNVDKLFYSENSGKLYGIYISETDSLINIISIDLKLKICHSVSTLIKISNTSTFWGIEFLTAFNTITDDLYLVNKDSLVIINAVNASIYKSIPLPMKDFMQITYNKRNGLIYGLSVGNGCLFQLTKFNPANNTFQSNQLSHDIRAFNRFSATMTNDGNYIFGRAEDYYSLIFVSDNGKIVKEIVTDIDCVVTY